MDGNSIYNLIESISIIIASGVAIYGINSWRRETKWKRRNELAEEILFNLYDARDRLRIIRHPFAHPTEGESRPALLNEPQAEKTTRNYAYVTVERYNNNREPFLNLEKLKYRYMVYFGATNVDTLNEMVTIKNEVLSASYKYARLTIQCDKLINMRLNKVDNATQIQTLNNQIEVYSAVIWEDYSEEDSIKMRVNDLIEQQEDILKKYLH